MKVLIKSRSMSTSQGMARNGDIVELAKEEVDKILAVRPLHHRSACRRSSKESAKESSSKKKRARNDDGTLKADDPSTPDVNEAWEDG